jgi:hypothetical protein
MVPATMCRTALRAALCAVAVGVCPLLIHAQVAYADEPVPLGQVAPSDAPSADDASGAEDDPGSSGDADGWSVSDWWEDGWDGASWTDPSWGSSWDDGDWGWSWDDLLADDGSGRTPPDASEAAPPADEAPADEAPAEEAPADEAPADEAPVDEALTADALLATATDVLAAPTMSVSGTTVSWTPIAGVSWYVFVRKVPGQAARYSLVNGTSVTPPAVPGQTVSYGVRTNLSGSTWAQEVSIDYPAATVPDTTAPTMSSSGNTVSWTRINAIASYVFVRKVPGQAAQYSLVNGTSVTPPAVPGTTVSYGVRTNVSASAWAGEVSIAYPATSPPPAPSPPPPPVDGSFQMGVVAGSAHQYELSFLKSLGVHTARIELGVGTSAASMASDIDAYARAGIRPLLLATFYGRTPTAAEAQNVGSWAAAYGPGGTFWQGKSYPANTAVTSIEFGNETSYSYQFSDNSLSTYVSRASTYALRARDAANAIRAANPSVGLLAQGDNAVNQTAWVTSMLRAVPTLDDLVAGWTIHPYGPNWASRIDATINSAAAVGSRALPIWITEWGLSSDNGRCLSDNYGWSKCMTYSTAASTLHGVLAGMQSRYGSRLGAFYLYQAHDQYPSGSQSGREAYFGALQSNATAKGAYTTEVKADLAAN